MVWQITLRATPTSGVAGSTSDGSVSSRSGASSRFSTIALNCSRFSPRWIASMEAPISSTPYFSSTPFSCNATAAFRAVWPPRVASNASGRSLAITCSTNSGVIGSM